MILTDNKTDESDYLFEVTLIFNELIKKPEIVEALKLFDKLPSNLCYHNKDHTLDVIKETILFAVVDYADRDTIELEAIAAAWHDVGYIKQSENHELISAELFKQSKTYEKLPSDKRDEIVSNILDTQIIVNENEPFLLKKNSKNGYVLDADVSNFGRKDYFQKGELVAKELGVDLSNPIDKKNFYNFAYKLLKNHRWKSGSAKFLRQYQKEENIKQLERLTNKNK